MNATPYMYLKLLLLLFKGRDFVTDISCSTIPRMSASTHA